MRICRIHFILVALCLVLTAVQSGFVQGTAQAVSVKLQVQDEGGKAIANVSLLVNELPTSIDAQGYQAIALAPVRLYRLKVSAPGFYSMRHTFSEQERQLFNGIFPNVTLVKKVPGRVMLALAGDAMVGRRYHEPNPGDPRLVSEDRRLEDSKALLTTIKPYLDLADYTSINLETPVLEQEPEQRSPKTVTFYSYPETLEALSWAGIDHVSLGNNHTYDYLGVALEETLNRLSESGLGYSGAGRDASAARQPFRTSVQGVNFSFFGFVGWPGKVLPSQIAEGEAKGGAAHGTGANIISSLSAEDSSRVAVVEYHGSNEYSFAPTDETRDRLRSAIDHGADMAIGHHPHVLHGFEVYKGKLIAYSLGNFLFDQYIYETQRSALLYVWMDGEQFHRAEIVPLYIKTYRPTPAMGKMREYVLRRLTEQSSVENVSLGYSGGHGVIGELSASRTSEQTPELLTVDAQQQLIELPDWRQQFVELSFNTSGVPYRIGRDWWSLGDFEQERQFRLLDRSWSYSNRQSGIGTERALGRYAMKLYIPAIGGRASVGQQYFMRVWDDQPKSIALDIYAQEDVEVRACLELRTGAMTTTQGRLNPVVRCLEKVSVSKGDWRQVLFDFDPPQREGNRGLRFRFEVFSQNLRASSVYFDNMRFISWESGGVSQAGKPVSLAENKRWNMVRIAPLQTGETCCQISTRRIRDGAR